MADERNAVLIIRAWTEPHPELRLRVTVRHTVDVNTGLDEPCHLADVDSVTQVVRRWLHDVAERGYVQG